MTSSASGYSKSLTIDDFRGISISPVLSKIFEQYLIVTVSILSLATISLGLNVNLAVHMQFTHYDLQLITMLIMAVLSTCVHWIYQRRSTRWTIMVCLSSWWNANLNRIKYCPFYNGGSQLVSHVLNGATNFQRSLTCHVAFDKAGYCRHIYLPVSLTAWLTK